MTQIADRFKHGLLIEYDPIPECIILDVSLFGSVFGEFEIIIDATKTKIKNITEL